MPYDSFLIKFLFKKKVCGSRKQCMGPIETQLTLFSNKNKKSEMLDVKCRLNIQTSTKSNGAWVFKTKSL